MKFQASAQGLQIVDATRQRKGWPKTAIPWCEKAQVSETTLKRFWRGNSIRAHNFQAICAAVGITDWETIVDWSTHVPPSPFFSQQTEYQERVYIERPPVETRCFEEIHRPGALIRLKAPPQMGKTWLIHRIFQHAKAQGYHVFPLNLLQVDDATMQNLDALLRWFCSSVSRRLGIENQVTEIWETASSSNDNCTAYFESCIFNHLQAPLIIGLENVDRTFQYPTIAADFLGLLRSWYEDARTLESWQKLRVILAHSTEAYIRLDANRSPFNIGLPIELPEFTPAQVTNLTQRQGLHWQPEAIDALMSMVGGHPYLVQQAIETVVNQPELSLETLLAIAPTQEGPYRNHLRNLQDTLQQSPSLTYTLQQIVAADEPLSVDRDEGFKLQSIGLIRWCSNKATPFCNLYRHYFRDCLSLPHG
ncbi:MAG: AAA-like domain-containing protein [Leptolyngbyaceae cyanobacterium]